MVFWTGARATSQCPRPVSLIGPAMPAYSEHVVLQICHFLVAQSSSMDAKTGSGWVELIQARANDQAENNGASEYDNQKSFARFGSFSFL